MNQAKTNVIVIYHHPQECGSPYLTFISQESGQVLETIDIPDGYYDSGQKMVTTLQKVYSYTEDLCTTRVPSPESYIPKAKYGHPGNRYKYKVTGIDVNGEDLDIIHTYDVTVHIDACIEKRQYKYVSSMDEFKARLSEAGFDMTGWCCYKRQKTDFNEFLQDICSKYKDYHPISILTIN